MKQIPLTRGKFAMVDDADFEWLSQRKWCAAKGCTTYYAVRHSHQINERPIHVKMHREILDLVRGDKRQCDHINGNGLDNRRVNLRSCTSQQNSFNQKSSGGSSKFKGVHWHRTYRKWKAQIQHKNKRIYIGLFDNEIEAALAYDGAAKDLFGEFARSNFVN